MVTKYEKLSGFPTRSATGVGFHTVLAILPGLAVASVSEIKMAKLQRSAPGDKSPGYNTAPHKWGFSCAFPAGWKYARKAGFNRRCAIAGRFIARWVSGAVLFIDLPAGEPAGFISACFNTNRSGNNADTPLEYVCGLSQPGVETREACSTTAPTAHLFLKLDQLPQVVEQCLTKSIYDLILYK